MHDSRLHSQFDSLEIEQDPDLTDSDMLEVIQEKLSEGWRLEVYYWEEGIKKYRFEFK